MYEKEIFSSLDIAGATKLELCSQNRLLPPRSDYRALQNRHEEVARWLAPHIRRASSGHHSSVLFADKGWRGARPLTIMTLADGVYFRALVEALKPSLPSDVTKRPAFDEFNTSILSSKDVNFVAKTDAVAFYEYIDHEILEDELVSQTGREALSVALVDHLGRIMGRRLGLPQVHASSDVLGDAYMAIAKRRLLRAGLNVSTYSDDYRIGSADLGEARQAISTVAWELRRLGLVLNERKTLTYERSTYVTSLGSYKLAEEALFEDATHGESGLRLLREEYQDDWLEEEITEDDGISSLADDPIDRAADDQDSLATGPAAGGEIPPTGELALAAERAWTLWETEDDEPDKRSGQDSILTQSLLARALPVLGRAGSLIPLENLSTLLRLEPSLTPQIAHYITNLVRVNAEAVPFLQNAFDEVVESRLLSQWQSVWIAYCAGFVIPDNESRPYVRWLEACVGSPNDALAANAASALGRMRIGNPDLYGKALEQVGGGWRQLVLWGLARVDMPKASAFSEGELDRILLGEMR